MLAGRFAWLGQTLVSLGCVLVFAAGSQAQTELAWKFVPGSSHEIRLTQTARLTSGSDALPTTLADIEQQIDYVWSVLEVNPEGTATISLRVTSFSLNARGPGGQEVAYDSTSTEDPQGYSAMLVPIGLRLGEDEVRLTITAAGAVNLEELPTDLAEAVKSVPGGKLFAEDGGAASFRALIRMGAPLALPDSPIEQNHTWTESAEMAVPPWARASPPSPTNFSRLLPMRRSRSPSRWPSR